jgi:hypothetical protein
VEKSGIEPQRENEKLFSHLISALRSRDVLAGRAELYHSLANLSASDMPGLIERARKLPFKYRNQLVASLFNRWLELDRSGAEKWLRAGVRDNACYAAWAKVAPNEAIKFALDPKSPPWLWQAVQNALQALAGEDRRARLMVLDGIAPSAMRDRMVTDEFKKWADSEPAAALAWLSAKPAGKLRDSLEQEGVIRLIKADSATAIDRANKLIPSLKARINGNEFVSQFTSALAATDPLRALDFAQSLPVEFQEHPLIAATAEWAKQDPLVALDWAQTNGINLAEDYEYGPVSTSTTVLRLAFESQPGETVDWVLALPDGNDRSRWIQYLMDEDFLKGDMDLGQRLFDALPLERQRQSAYDFGEALAANGRLPDLDEWARLFPNEAVRARVVGAAVGQFFDRAPARAEAILAEIPQGPIRDQTLAELSQRQSYATPAAAAARALEIRDEIVRYDALEEVFGRWLGRDRPTATDWIKAQENLPRAWVEEWLAQPR